MKKHNHAVDGEAVTGLVLDLFRLNSRLLITGDRLVADLGLTSARWQILGAIAQADRPRPVAWLARDMGGNRQNVQRIVNDLHQEGIVVFEPNPHHRRAQLVVLTEHGKATYEAAVRLWNPLVEDLAAGLSAGDVAVARKVMMALRGKLETLIGEEAADS